MFAYCGNNPVMYVDYTGQLSVANIDDRNFLDDWILDGASVGGYGGGYLGSGSAYHNYAVYSGTSTYNAGVGGYYSRPVSSGVLNTSYYYVPGAVFVTDSMNTSSRGSTAKIHPSNLVEKLALESVKSNPQGNPSKTIMADPRWPAKEGWIKMQQIVKTSTEYINIHYLYNTQTHIYDDFKIKEIRYI